MWGFAASGYRQTCVCVCVYKITNVFSNIVQPCIITQLKQSSLQLANDNLPNRHFASYRRGPNLSVLQMYRAPSRPLPTPIRPSSTVISLRSQNPSLGCEWSSPADTQRLALTVIWPSKVAITPPGVHLDNTERIKPPITLTDIYCDFGFITKGFNEERANGNVSGSGRHHVYGGIQVMALNICSYSCVSTA